MADFTLRAAASEPLTAFVGAIEPYGIKNQEGTALRKTGFSKADSNGSGMASLAEIENFISSALQKGLDDDDKAGDLFKLFRPCYKNAFNRAKVLGKSDGKVLKGMKSATSDDYISFKEFRIFCVYLTIYAAMYDIFTSVDGGNLGRTDEDDARISEEEFMKMYPTLGGLGFQALQGLDSDEKASTLFHAVDTNNGGFILFKEWATYIRGQEIKANTHIGTLLRGDLKSSGGKKKISAAGRSQSTGRQGRSTSKSSFPSSRSLRPSSAMSSKRTQVKSPGLVGGVYKPSAKISTELKEFIASISPYAEKTPAALKLRKAAFKNSDTNGSGKCSLAEVEVFVMNNVKKTVGHKKGAKVFDLFRPCYLLAFNEAKNLKANETGNDDGYINFQEFRVLNTYLCIFAGMFDAFVNLDGKSVGVTKDDDRRVDEQEWMSGYTRITKVGFVGLDFSSKKEAISTFKAMDLDSSGRATITEFTRYLAEAEIKADTPMGKLFAGSSLKLKSYEDSEVTDRGADAVAEDVADEKIEATEEYVDEQPAAEEEPAEDEEEEAAGEEEAADDEPADEEEPAEDEEEEAAEEEPADEEVEAGEEPAEEEPADDEEPAEEEEEEVAGEEPAGDEEPAEDEEAEAEEEPAEEEGEEAAEDEPAGDEEPAEEEEAEAEEEPAQEEEAGGEPADEEPAGEEEAQKVPAGTAP